MARKVKDPISRINDLLASSEREFKREFVRMVELMRDQLSMTELTRLLERGRVDQALGLLEAAASKLGVAWSKSFSRAAVSTAAHVNRHVPIIDFSFDQTNTAAVEAMRRNRLRLIRGFTDQQRRTVRQALADGVEQGLNPRDQARLFRDSIGLTPYQERIVRNYRRNLEEGDKAALERALRDRRFDPSAQRAIDGQTLPKKQIDKMVEAYRRRMINHRAETIARTESLRAVHEGVHNTYEQAIDQGVLNEQDLKRTWNTAGDRRVRHSHSSMDGQEKSFREPFISGNGSRLMYPTDPSGPAEDTVNCRCVVATTMDLGDAHNMAGISVEIEGL